MRTFLYFTVLSILCGYILALKALPTNLNSKILRDMYVIGCEQGTVMCNSRLHNEAAIDEYCESQWNITMGKK